MDLEKVQEKLECRLAPSGLVAILFGAAFLMGLTLYGVYGVQEYGAALFVIGPIAHGLFVAGILRIGGPRKIGTIIGHSLVSLLLYIFSLLFFGFEGLICIVMAAPLAIPGDLLGAALGHLLFHGAFGVRPGAGLVIIGLVATSAGHLEKALAGDPSARLVSTEMLIDAPAEVVWQRIVSLRELPEPDDWVFKIGVACPRQTEIRGVGLGAARHCTLSTGGMPQEIDVWQPGRRLGWLAMSTPPPLKEINPFLRVEPPHLHGYFTIERGDYILKAHGSRTLLIRRTWYRSRLRPAAYWDFCSDMILDRGHRLVMRHLKHVSEQPASLAKAH